MNVRTGRSIPGEVDIVEALVEAAVRMDVRDWLAAVRVRA